MNTLLPGQGNNTWQILLFPIIISYLLKWIEVIPNSDVKFSLLIPVHPKTLSLSIRRDVPAKTLMLSVVICP